MRGGRMPKRKKQKRPEPQQRPPAPELYEPPEGFPRCCEDYYRFHDVVGTNHMILLDVEDPLLPENGVVRWGSMVSSPIQELWPSLRQMVPLYVEAATALMPIGRRCKVVSKKGEKIMACGDDYAGCRVGPVGIIRQHWTWARKMIGKDLEAWAVGPLMPVLLVLDGELRGFIVGDIPAGVKGGALSSLKVFGRGHR